MIKKFRRNEIFVTAVKLKNKLRKSGKNIEYRTPINARPPLAGMMKWWKHKTSKFGVSVKDRQALFGVLRFKETSSDCADFLLAVLGYFYELEKVE